jgi:pimeloyl-ACP methyl ester carboxylesterase
MAIERATMGRLPSAALGAGPAVAVLAGLSPTTGVDGDWIVRGTLGSVANLSGAHRVVLFNRRPHLRRGMSMAELAAEQADAIREGLTPPVDVIGMSTGGSLALQLAADHPDVVRRLVVISAACRLGPKGKRLQRRVAARIRAGAPRQALAVLASDLVPAGRGQTVAAGLAWLIGPTVIKDPLDLDDMATTIEAEDGFDLADCRTITAPTLVIAGREDDFYGPELFEETARLIPGSELRLVADRGHVTVMGDRGARAALSAFLTQRT